MNIETAFWYIATFLIHYYYTMLMLAAATVTSVIIAVRDRGCS